jgi:hypothetical protein
MSNHNRFIFDMEPSRGRSGLEDELLLRNDVKGTEFKGHGVFVEDAFSFTKVVEEAFWQPAREAGLSLS